MRKNIKVAVLSFALTLGISVGALAQSTATEFVRVKSDEIIRIVNTSGNQDTRLRGLKSAVASTLDFQLLAERTLSRHWGDLTAKQKTDFVAALQDLIETSYSSRLGNETLEPGSYTVQFTDEKERRGRYTVSGIVSSRGDTYNIDVRLQKNAADAWQVYDIVTDDISLQESYAESFDEIIRSKGFDELLRRIRSNAAEMKKK